MFLYKFYKHVSIGTDVSAGERTLDKRGKIYF